MKPGELKRRQRSKALNLLANHDAAYEPYLTTTKSLAALDAECGPHKFHTFLAKRGLAHPFPGRGKGYAFDLPDKFGGATFTINHNSFHWTPAGLLFICEILKEECISYSIPEELRNWMRRNQSAVPTSVD